jgi:predicted NUDIX family NTP pyrophosphohydrolase
MIEGDFNALEVLYPVDGFGVVTGCRIHVPRPGEKSHAAGVTSGIAIGLRIDADERETDRLQAGLLQKLSPSGRLDRLSDIDETARQCKASLKGWIFSPNHKHTTGGVDNDAIDSQKRCTTSSHDISMLVEGPMVISKASAGVLLFRRRVGLEVLLAHPGGPYWQKKDDGAWTVPKGELQDGEDPYEAAVREFSEEIGFRPQGQPLSLGSLRQAGGKHVFVWAVEDDWDPSLLVSNTFVMEWPPRSGKRAQFPEIDRAGWFDLSTARRKILKSQSEFLRRLESAPNSDAY